MPTFLTDKLIRSKRIVLTDAGEPGLRLVIGTRSAVWSFATTTRFGDVRRDIFTSIGPIEEISLGMARLEAKKLKRDIKAGIDPNTARQLAAKQATTFAIQAAKWHPQGRAKHIYSERLNLRLAIGELNLADVSPTALTRRDLLALIELHRGHPAAVRNRIGALRRFLDHLVAMEIVENNIVRLLPPKAIPAPPKSRSQYPSASEIKRLWEAAAGLQPRFCDLIRLMLLVPLRRGEAAGLLRSEVDLERKEVRLPGSRTKNGADFVMPLSSAALAILKPLTEAGEERLFGPVFDWSHLLKQLRKFSSVANFNPHDTRRAFASELGEHEIGDHDLVDSLLAHSAASSRGSVGAVYNRSRRAGARREVMERWSEFVSHAVATGAWPREVEANSVVDLGTWRAAK